MMLVLMVLLVLVLALVLMLIVFVLLLVLVLLVLLLMFVLMLMTARGRLTGFVEEEKAEAGKEGADKEEGAVIIEDSRCRFVSVEYFDVGCE
jgi:predicted membrane protein